MTGAGAALVAFTAASSDSSILASCLFPTRIPYFLEIL